MNPRAGLAVALMCCATGCYPTYRHSIADAIKAPLRSDKGALAVVAPDGSRETFEAPYAVQPFPGGVRVSAHLLPSREYDTAQVRHLETRRFSVLATAGVIVGAVGLTAAAIWAITVVEVGLRGWSLLGNTRWPLF